MKKGFCLMFGAVALSTHLLAQGRLISGTVRDENGRPLANVSVLIKDKDVQTSTDGNGNFQISVPPGAKTLVFSAADRNVRELPLGNNGNQINISLPSAYQNLNEVVVVGYGVKSVRALTGAIGKIEGEKVAAVPLPSFDQALAGQVAGLQVNATGGVLADGVAMRVRGINSITSSSQPLVVIDGIPQMALTNTNGFNSGNGTRFNPLSLINPNDIASIEVLKDAAAGAIYGSRASNGVILITTKAGVKGTSRVDVNVRLGWSRASRLPQMLNGDDFIKIQNEKSQARYAADIARESDVNGDGQNDRTNWMDLLYRTGLTKDYNVSMSGGNEKTAYFGSARYLDQEGISYGNRLRSGQGRLKIDMSPKSWFHSGMEVSYARTLNNGILSDRYSAGSTLGWQAFPTLPAYNPGGPKGYNLSTASPVGILGWGNNSRTLNGTLYSVFNPIASVDLTRQNNTAEDLRGAIYGELQPVKWLKLTTRLGGQYLRNAEDQYTAPYLSGLGLTYNGIVKNQEQQWKLWNWQNYLTFDKTIALDHHINVLAGSDYQKNEYAYLATGASDFSDPFFQYVLDFAYSSYIPGTEETLLLTGGDRTSSGLESYFGRLSYAYKDKFFLEGDLRGDAFSGFGANNRWGYFPGLSAGWEISKESFLAPVKAINYLKLRASYGKVGNQTLTTDMSGANPYASRTLYGGAVYTTSTGLGNIQSGNAGLKWESVNKLDIGMDTRLWQNRIGLTVDYFKDNINNLILQAPVLYTVGVPNSVIYENIGKMYNKGVEATISASPVTAGNFRWTTSLNYTRIANKVTDLVAASGNTDITSPNALAPAIQVASAGKPLGEYYLPVWAGVDPQTGNPMWYSKDGTIKRYNFGSPAATLWTDEKGKAVSALGTGDYVYTGKSGLPKWYGGWENNFSWKGFDLGIMMVYQGGNYLYNQTRATLLTNTFLNNSTEILQRWQKAGDRTDVPRLYLSDNTANGVSTRFLEKGDYLKVRTITLAYNADRKLLAKAGFENARIYVQAFNAFTLTGYKGADPEVNTNRTDNIAVGYDLRNVPQPRTFSIGIQAGF